MLSIRQAIELMQPSFSPVGCERVPLMAALDRVLATDVPARYDLPGFDNSAMDGYALRARDVAAPLATLPVQGESRAGGELPEALLAGHVMRIFTGAPLPRDADTVVMQEHTSGNGESVTVHTLPKPGSHVRRQGSDLRAGDLALRAGAVLGPGELGLLASQDHATPTVHRTPRVALLSTGDELRELASAARPGSIVDSNAYCLAAAIRRCGAEPWILPIIKDDRSELERTIRDAMQHADVLLTIGGVSVGEYDLVARALTDAGITLGFHKVAIKPGKPLLFGTAGRVPVVGLPGNPVSALVTFEVFVHPMLRRMLGHREPFPVARSVELEAAYEHAPERTELARATLQQVGDREVARLLTSQGSGSLPSLVGVDALVIFPRGSTHFSAGQVVRALSLRACAYAAAPPFDE